MKDGLKGRLKGSDLYFWVFAAALFLVRHLLAVRLPIAPRSYSTDDLLMVQMAEGLRHDGWLGDYRYATLMKGMFFPLFLAGAGRSGLTHLGALSLMNALACLYFVQELRVLLPDWRCRLPLFAVLLFEPCMCAELSFQRVYRCSVTEMQVLFLFGSYFGGYLRADRAPGAGPQSGRRASLWPELCSSLVGGAALWSMWNSREESAWVIPFVGTATALTGLRLALAFRKGRLPGARLAYRGLLCLLPCLLLLVGNSLVRRRNLDYYGAAVRLEEEDGTFRQAIQTIYSVKNRAELPCVTVSREKLDRLYEVSPSLQSIRKELEEQLAFYDTGDRHPGDGEVEDGWFFWGLRRAAHSAGAADTLPKSQAFWLAVHREIEAALSEPDTGLERQPVMPSALMSPWRAEYARKLPGSVLGALRYVASYRDVGVLTQPSGKAGHDSSVRFESMTGNRALYREPELADQNRRVVERMMPAAVVFNGIADLYRLLNPLVLVLAAVLYLRRLAGLVLQLFGSARLSGNRPLSDGRRPSEESCSPDETRPSVDESLRKDVSLLLIAAGMALSALVMILGACYTDLSAFGAIRYHYLAGVYPLMIASEWIMILSVPVS